MKNINWKFGFGIAAALSLITLSFRITLTTDAGWHLHALSLVYTFVYNISIWVAMNALLNNTKRMWFLESKILIAACIAVTALLGIIEDWAFNHFTGYMLQQAAAPGIKRYFIMFFRAFLLSSFYYFLAYYLHVLSEKQKHSLEIERLKQVQLAANISSLKEQLSPHFLFNTLNTLSSITHEKEVKEYISELANVYRYLLTYKKADSATLEQELTFIESYLYIIKARMESALEIVIQVDSQLLSSLLPPLTLQLLIENAIKHNVASVSRPLTISIYNEGSRELVVSNYYQPKSLTPFSTGVGLDNVIQRYRLLFDKDIVIEKTKQSFSVKLPIIIP
ncbi:sensor histidine kinase [Algoriphagus sp. Y33]|uniref:sensor histidine kinase n=1 Tax=Algoriphagus sp. Y33 TaxID=2772483 RepID=UPI0017821AFD|nr:histidine kinase [Algoriphagus sp. Y33]